MTGPMVRSPRNLEELHEQASRPDEGVRQVLAGIESDILVLGAGGKMGFHLTRMLQRGLREIGSRWKPIAVSRFGSPSSREPFERHGIDTLAVDLTRSAELEALPEVGAVFYLAGVKFGTAEQPETLHRLNVELPRRVATRFVHSRVVALSTGCVYRFETPARGGSVESDPVGPRGQYAESCVGRERAFEAGGGNVSLVRLNYSVDLRYGVLVDLARQVLKGEPVDVTTGWFNCLWQGDANRYIIGSLPFAAAPPFVINVTGSQTLSVRETATWFGERFGKRVGWKGKEVETAWLSNASRAHQLWGTPHVSEMRLMEWVADWLERGGETLDKPTHFEVRSGNY